MNTAGNKKQLKREILIRIIKAFFSKNFEENIRLIPFNMRPKGMEVPYRCCIYKERAIIKDRTIAGLGFMIEDDDETVSLSTYAKRALERKNIDNKNLTVLQAACKGCLTNRIFVTDLCQGCVDRPCLSACKFNAISVNNGKSCIDELKCKKCKMCISACPYKAIAKITVPCEEVCFVGAIKKDETGFAVIDYDKCIYCGKCISSCPFGAVHEKSQIIDILKALTSDKKVIALIAPSIAGQFPGNLYQLKTAIMQTGFNDVFEVAKGADVTAQKEAKEFVERMKQNKSFMTTSCCSGYNQLVKKHFPEIKPFVSDTKTPLYYTAEFIKNKFPDAVTVFISPCVAKKAECFEDKNIDFVMNFEELAALFETKNIKTDKCQETKFDTESSKQGRRFGITGGVAEALSTALPDITNKISVNALNGKMFNINLFKKTKTYSVNGLDKESVLKLKHFVRNNKTDDDCNLIEVMCCSGGCVGGNAALNEQKKAGEQINRLTEHSKDINKIKQ